MQFIDVTVIRRTYSGERKILDSLNFEKDEKALDFIISEPGEGKSTFMEAAAGLIKPVSGKILIDEAPLLLLQVPERGFTSATCGEEAGEGLTSVGFEPDIAGVSPWSLSRGERKRLAFGAILKCNTGRDGPVLLLDDPFTDLDIFGKKIIINSIIKRKFTTLITTNREDDPELFRDTGLRINVYRMKEGKVTRKK